MNSNSESTTATSPQCEQFNHISIQNNSNVDQTETKKVNQIQFKCLQTGSLQAQDILKFQTRVQETRTRLLNRRNLPKFETGFQKLSLYPESIKDSIEVQGEPEPKYKNDDIIPDWDTYDFIHEQQLLSEVKG
eukprot:403360190